MKKLFASIAVLTLFASCDDGDVTYEDLDFQAGVINICSSANPTVLYKTETDQAFLINLPNLNTGATGDLPVQPGTASIPISGDTRVVYRHFNGTVATDNICAAIPPATPTVDEEWTASAGNILVTTTLNRTINPATDANFPGGETISSLSHAISFQDITFNTGSGSQTYNTFPFGTYTENLTGFAPALPSAGSLLKYCPEENSIYFVGATRLFVVKLSAYQLDPTVLGVPKPEFINGDTVQAYFRTYPAGTVLDSPSLSCTQVFDATEASQWTAVNGSGTDGIIEVTTVSDVSGAVKHSIRLLNVRLALGEFNFLIATEYFLGEIVVQI